MAGPPGHPSRPPITNGHDLATFTNGHDLATSLPCSAGSLEASDLKGGYTEADIGDLVPGPMKQQRLLATCARPVTGEDIAAIFAASIQNW